LTAAAPTASTVAGDLPRAILVGVDFAMYVSMIAFGVVLLLTKTSYRIAAVAVAILLPLALYAFFAHVAAVPIPQGLFVRLP